MDNQGVASGQKAPAGGAGETRRRRGDAATLAGRRTGQGFGRQIGLSAARGRHRVPFTVHAGRNSQAVEVYVALESGVWRYDGPKHLLEQVLPGDLRAKAGGAPVTLFFAAPADDQWGGEHVGSLYQNAGLYCASAKMACVVRISGANGLKDVLTLPAGWRVRMALAAGRPK